MIMGCKGWGAPSACVLLLVSLEAFSLKIKLKKTNFFLFFFVLLNLFSVLE